MNVMQDEPISIAALWTGRVMTGLAILFFVMDFTIKFLNVPQVAQTMQRMGWPPGKSHLIAGILLVCTALYAWPRTAVLGAILVTGYLGGAVASHVRIDSPLFSHILFGVYLGILVWGGLWLRDRRLQALIPLRRP
jgi:DoxX-like family